MQLFPRYGVERCRYVCLYGFSQDHRLGYKGEFHVSFGVTMSV